jgi:hypothetical protein
VRGGPASTSGALRTVSTNDVDRVPLVRPQILQQPLHQTRVVSLT